jgi:hypothetical protein
MSAQEPLKDSGRTHGDEQAQVGAASDGDQNQQAARLHAKTQGVS